MSTPASSSETPPAPAPGTRLRRLLPPGDPTTPQELVDSYGLRELGGAGARPYLMLNMISTADGRASVGGRSGALGNRADRELFTALRAAVDAVLVGAGTLRRERYGRIIRDAQVRQRRTQRGLRSEPLACVVSSTLTLPADIPLLDEPDARVVVLTPSAASLPGARAQVDYVRAERNGMLDLPAAMTELRERFSIGTLLCEGGPHLNGELLAAGLVDELLLSLAPLLAGGDGEAQLRIIAGHELAPPLSMRLVSVTENDSHLFLRYGL
jgi:riboflavin biosynthesis pyrimidine reductase